MAEIKKIKVGSTTYDIESSNIPTKTSELNNDSGFITNEDIPSVDQDFDTTSANAQSGKSIAGKTWDAAKLLLSTNDLDEVVGESIGWESLYYWTENSQPTNSPVNSKKCFMSVKKIAMNWSEVVQQVYPAVADSIYYERRKHNNSWGEWKQIKKVEYTSELTNNSGFITGSGVNDIQVVDELPAEPVATTLYLIRE